MRFAHQLASLSGAGLVASSAVFRRQDDPNSCPGYTATNIRTSDSGLSADLSLAGPACNIYGTDLPQLKLDVIAETSSRLHVKIYDPDLNVYQVPEKVIPRPDGTSEYDDSELQFSYEESPFSFAIVRKSTGEALFNTSGTNIIFESQYLRLRTQLPQGPHLYGLGESTDPFELLTNNYSRTLWSRDALGTPAYTNLYGNHPVYFDHRGSAGTHGVFLLSSSGMDVKIDQTEQGDQYLEYNTLGGIIDLYFLAGPSPTEVSKQYAEIVGLPAMQPYWGWGFHQCKYGYRDVYEVAEVVANYSAANIPLETMWTDIDYMELRRVFTVDPERFPIHLMRELVDYLHEHQQHYVVMVDPAVAHRDYPPYNRGVEDGIFLKNANGSGVYTGVVWPGPASFPDWFASDVQNYWNNEFAMFFDSDTGVDIDALWIDMNEASNFCIWPCDDPYGFAEENGDPPTPPPVRDNSGRPIAGFPADFQPSSSARLMRRDMLKRQAGGMLGLPGRDLLDPPYEINNTAGSLSNLTIRTDLQHENGLYLYDTHNMYGTMMSEASRGAMLNRRPGRRPLVITRSTFAGAGASVGHWLGDNLATWNDYRESIKQVLEFSALFQVPMVGADVCGFSGYNTTIKLCQRWATLGAFHPFFRNHADLVYNGIPIARHEFYIWPEVAEVARDAINRRYQLLDYIYTAFHQQTVDGTPHIKPLFFEFPSDDETSGIGYQFFYGDALLISPVHEDNGTDVTFYVPEGEWYDYFTFEKLPASQSGQWNTRHNVSFSEIPVHIRGGYIIPRRIESANTTTELRKKDFELIVALDADSKARGTLYLDEGDAIEQPATSQISFSYENGELSLDGSFNYDVGDVKISKVTVLGCRGEHGGHGGHGPPGGQYWERHGGPGPYGGHHGGPHEGGCGQGPFDVQISLAGARKGKLH
ncbi:glycoside hydrolase family 31 protein [Polychaeton citri CBS 116435]|uniref:alpha-glucosidase n=1 Tax=Polychaeton citri CBS 116435 TaxID=1314669 RepID=A0A9P4PZ90_9PEZI|nr:glycoside hydrolase family 31 protein [Polychaeton citri CBS 116435]